MLTHKGTRELRTGRLVLRRVTEGDAEIMYRNWASDDEVTKFLTWPTHESVEITKMVLSEWTGSYDKPDFYNWAITLKENGDEPIGNISVVRINSATDCAAMGYAMSRAHWRKGIMPEALKALVDFLFDEVGFNRIEAEHDVNNPASGKVMEKAGLRYEGTLRQSGHSNQGIIDVVWRAILKQDWRSEHEQAH